MAKLPSIDFRHQNETGETMQFRSTVTLDQGGTFNVTIPDDLYDSASGMRKTVAVSFTHPANSHSWRVSGESLNVVKQFIHEAMADAMKCEVTTERVIVYGHSLKVCYSAADDGSIHPNGYMSQRVNSNKNNGGGYKFGGELHATNHAPLYSVGLGAKVFDKVTYHRNSGKKVEFKRVDKAHFQFNSPMEKLDAFVGLNIKPESSQEMPYSDEAATFFYDAMIAMCKLAQQVEAFLGDKQTLMHAIESRATLLPAPKAA